MSGDSKVPTDPAGGDGGGFDLLSLIDDTPQGRFERFHEENPHVYRALVDAAREYRRATRAEKCGMSLLFGRVRWVLSLETSEDVPRLNNNYASFYARLIMEREEDLATMFDLRRSLADEWDASNAA